MAAHRIAKGAGHLPPELAQLFTSSPMTIDVFVRWFTGVVILLWLLQLVLDYSKKTRQMLIMLAVAVMALVVIAVRIIR